MGNILENELIEAICDIENNVKCISDLIDKISLIQGETIEKQQCLEAMKDFTDIINKRIANAKSGFNNLHDKELKKEKAFQEEHGKLLMKDTKVLVVDDNNINNFVVAQMLKQFGIKSDIALSGEEAVDLFNKNNYDMILMDYLMPPGIDGIETVKRIRNSGERGKKQLIIGLTANTIAEFKEGLNKYGVELILFKPVKHQQMAVILQKELSDKVVTL